MHTALADKRNEPAELCRLHGVARLEIFGSGARAADYDPQTSDLDFLVEFESPSATATLNQYFDFRDALNPALDRPIDLLEPRAIRNPHLLAAIDQSRRLIYAS